ncbi:transposase [Chitinophaga solisilvae]|uniref:transposase n=1 Tax=Chitinophaga solisilvae TaxID=1233460 RepID=UPI003B82ED32
MSQSRYLLFKHLRPWTREQQLRTELLFSHYPLFHKSYQLSPRLGEIYRQCKCKEETFKKRALWYNDVEEAGIFHIILQNRCQDNQNSLSGHPQLLQ